MVSSNLIGLNVSDFSYVTARRVTSQSVAGNILAKNQKSLADDRLTQHVYEEGALHDFLLAPTLRVTF